MPVDVFLGVVMVSLMMFLDFASICGTHIFGLNFSGLSCLLVSVVIINLYYIVDNANYEYTGMLL